MEMNSDHPNKKRRFSLSYKLNFVSVALLLAFAAGVVLISYTVQKNRIQEEYFDTAEMACLDASAKLSGKVIPYLKEVFESDEFASLREQGDEAKAEEWLQDYQIQAPDDPTFTISAGILYDFVWDITVKTLMTNDITNAYILYEKDGQMYYLCSPEKGILASGTPVPDFRIKRTDSSGDSPATVYQSGSEQVCRASSSIYADPDSFFLDTSSDNICALFCVEIKMGRILEVSRHYLYQILSFAAVFIAVCILLNILFVRRFVTAPVNKLSEATCRFGAEKGDAISMKDVIDVDIHSHDEIRDLYEEIRTMQKGIVNYTNDLTALTEEKARVTTEMHLAANIQSSVLKDSASAFPDQTAFSLAALMDPAREVGGDFYEFFFTDKDHLALIIADVSGKGIPAALFMMQSLLLLKSHAKNGGTPAGILAAANNDLCESNDAKMFVTVWLGILDIRTGKLICSNAGHEYPAVCGNDKAFRLVKDRHGLVLGCMSGVKYSDYELPLEKGGMLFVYTDGAPEANNKDGEFYGTERMLDMLTKNASGGPEALIRAVEKDISDFAGGAEQFDDLTMLCVEYKG